MAEKVGNIIKRILDDALKKSVQFEKDLEQLIPKHELHNYECSVSVEDIGDGIKLSIRRFKRKQRR